jgi:gliding motility-associated-like protein
MKSYGIESYELLIFNRWGEVIYTLREGDPGWDGTYKGLDCPNDVYVWKLIAYDYEGINHERSGHVTLIR